MVFEKVKKIIAEELNVEEEKIAKDSNFQSDLGADSLDALELIMRIEEEFDISIDDENAKTITTVGQIVDYIENNK